MIGICTANETISIIVSSLLFLLLLCFACFTNHAGSCFLFLLSLSTLETLKGNPSGCTTLRNELTPVERPRGSGCSELVIAGEGEGEKGGDGVVAGNLIQ